MENPILSKLEDLSILVDIIENMLSVSYSLAPQDERKEYILDGTYFLSKQLTSQLSAIITEAERGEQP